MKLTSDILRYDYEDCGLSLAAIAQKHGVSRQTVFRAMNKFGIQRRTKSEAHKLALETERFKHPTKGKKRSEKDKSKISDGMKAHWTQKKENNDNSK
jgi:transposase-like protein